MAVLPPPLEGLRVVIAYHDHGPEAGSGSIGSELTSQKTATLLSNCMYRHNIKTGNEIMGANLGNSIIYTLSVATICVCLHGVHEGGNMIAEQQLNVREIPLSPLVCGPSAAATSTDICIPFCLFRSPRSSFSTNTVPTAPVPQCNTKLFCRAVPR
jgi:hypothetical protein